MTCVCVRVCVCTCACVRVCMWQVSGDAVVDSDMYVSVSFTNPYSFTLYNVFLFMEGSGVMDIKSHFSQYAVTFDP